MTLNNLGNVLRDLGERAQARQAYEEALPIYTRCAKAEPKAFAGYLVTVARNAGKLIEQTGEKPDDWPALAEAQKLLSQFKAAEKEDTQDES